MPRPRSRCKMKPAESVSRGLLDLVATSSGVEHERQAFVGYACGAIGAGRFMMDWRDISAHLKCTKCGTVGYVDTRLDWCEVIDFNKGIS